ncbi:MAG: TOBE domain-containing protein [Deltaproteobacteria bacterium]|nr:TOBE domain-containing protein [Deltaproteobacteria bacterium]
MKLSARNVLEGKVVSIDKGMITCLVKLDIGGGHVISSVISKQSAEEMALAVGDRAAAVIKSTEVILAKD